MLRYGYISNGFADHSLEQMVQVLARFGYSGIGITLDHQHLDPAQATSKTLRHTRKLLEKEGLHPVIETGARFYLDAFRKHRPCLVSVDRNGRAKRVAYYRRAIEIAAELGANVVSLWSGAAPANTPESVSWERLTTSLPEVLDYAAASGVKIGFEPEPGMFIESLADFRELYRRLPHEALAMTVDLGHLAITEESPLPERLAECMPQVVNVHIDDIRERRHEHLPLGSGEIDFAPLLQVLRDANYDGVALVELSRHSHEAPLQAQRSLLYLRSL
ncbi:MAG: sugar phosphate isomerase/epimerase family protein [Planctomycetota bacterium]